MTREENIKAIIRDGMRTIFSDTEKFLISKKLLSYMNKDDKDFPAIDIIIVADDETEQFLKELEKTCTSLHDELLRII